MKKMILVATFVTLAIALSACSQSSQNKGDQDVKVDHAQDLVQETEVFQTYLGMVSEKIGNEITLSLGELILDNDSEAGQAMMIDEHGNQVPVDSSLIGDSAENSIIIMAPEDKNHDGNEERISNEIEKLPIAFTGEVKSFSIPAGTKIINGVGKEVPLDLVIKGSLIQIIVNEPSGRIESLLVW